MDLRLEITDRLSKEFDKVIVYEDINSYGFFLTVYQNGNRYDSHTPCHIPSNYKELQYDYLASVIDEFKKAADEYERLHPAPKKTIS